MYSKTSLGQQNKRIMRKRIYKVLVVAVLLAGCSLVTRAATTPVSEGDRRKAQYIYLEAHSLKQQGHADAFYDLLRYAHALDPSNTAISYYYGYCLLTMENTSRAAIDRGLALMKEYVDENPGSQYEVTFYSDANMMLGRHEEATGVLQRLATLNNSRTETLVRLARAYSQSNQHDHALAILDTVEMRQGKSTELTTQKANEYYELHDTVGALNEVRSLLMTAPRNVSYNLIMSSAFDAFGMSDSTFHYLQRAQQLEPDNGVTYLALARYYHEKGDTARFDEQVYKALINPNLDVDDKIDVLATYTGTLLRQGDSTQRVDNLFRVLLSQHPHEVKIHGLYSEYLVARKDYRGAAEQLQYALDIEPSNIESWKRIVVAYILNDDYDKAIEMGQRALEYNPDDMELYSYLGPSYYQIKQYDKAIEVYNKALAVAPEEDRETRSSLMGGLGDVYQAKGDLKRAVDCYDRALELDPGNTSVMNNYAYFLSNSGGDLERAERMAAIAVKENPDNGTFLDTYAWVYFRKGEYVMALLYIKKAIENMDEPNWEEIDHYGDILWFSDDHEGAVQQWQLALALNPDNELLQRKVNDKQYYEK